MAKLDGLIAREEWNLARLILEFSQNARESVFHRLQSWFKPMIEFHFSRIEIEDEMWPSKAFCR